MQGCQIKKFYLQFSIGFILAIDALILLNGCGGGGGGGATARLQGFVFQVGTETPPNPQAEVIAEGVSTRTSQQDGSFTLDVPVTSTRLLLRAQGYPEFEYPLPPLEAGKTYDLGNLYIGPQKVTVTGRVVDALTEQPVPEATVSLRGRTALTGKEGTQTGKFTLQEVAYDENADAEVPGKIEKNHYFPQEFTLDIPPDPNDVIDLGEIPIAPETGEPPGPGNVKGQVLSNTTIEIYRLPGETFLRFVIVTDPSGKFELWLGRGSYRLRFTNGSRGAVRDVTVKDVSERIDLGTIELR